MELLLLGIFSILALGLTNAEIDIKSKPSDFVENCGKPEIEDESMSSRIINGVEVTPHSYPWQVVILKDDYLCGGSLISRQHVLTAAHCFKESWKQINVILGAHEWSVNQTQAEGSITVNIQKEEQIIVHEDFFVTNPYDISDIAILVFEEPVTLTKYINVICLPTKNNNEVGDPVAMIGWGTTETGNVSFDALLKSNGKIVSKEDAVELKMKHISKLSDDQLEEITKETFPNAISMVIDGKNITVGPEMTREEVEIYVPWFIQNVTDFKKIIPVHGNGMESSACKGDSGGGLNYKGSDDRFVVIGATSFIPIASCHFLNIPEPIVFYSNVSFFMDWIKEKTGDI